MMSYDNLLQEKVEVINEEIEKIKDKMKLLDQNEKALKKELAKEIVNKEYCAALNNTYEHNDTYFSEMNESIVALEKKLDKLISENNYKRQDLLNQSSIYNSLLKELDEKSTCNTTSEANDFFSELLNKNPDLSQKLKPIIDNYSNLNINFTDLI